jgi:hypothetical protein
MENNRQYLEVAWAAQRSGLRYTAVNSHDSAKAAAFGPIVLELMASAAELAATTGYSTSAEPPAG